MFLISPSNRNVIIYAEVTISGNCCWKIVKGDNVMECFFPSDTNKTLIMSSEGNRSHRTIKRIIAENCSSGSSESTLQSNLTWGTSMYYVSRFLGFFDPPTPPCHQK